MFESRVWGLEFCILAVATYNTICFGLPCRYGFRAFLCLHIHGYQQSFAKGAILAMKALPLHCFCCLRLCRRQIKADVVRLHS